MSPPPGDVTLIARHTEVGPENRSELAFRKGVSSGCWPAQLRCPMDRFSSYPHLPSSPAESGSVTHTLWGVSKDIRKADVLTAEGA